LPAIKNNLAFPHILPLLFSDSRYAWDIGDDSDGNTIPLMPDIYTYFMFTYSQLIGASQMSGTTKQMNKWSATKSVKAFSALNNIKQSIDFYI